MARRGKYTVGLPRPGPNPVEIVNRWANVVRTHINEMAANYARNTLAVANSPEVLRQMAQKLEAWYAEFYAANIPLRYAEAIAPVKAAYKRRRYAIIAPGAARVAPPPAAPAAPVARVPPA